MSINSQTYSASELLQTNRKIFGHALQYAAPEFFSLSLKPLPSRLTEASTYFLKNDLKTRGAEYSDTSLSFFSAGLHDTYNILAPHIARHVSQIAIDQAIAIVQAPGTIETVAKLARRKSDDLTNLIRINNRHLQYFGLAQDESSLITTSHLGEYPEQGCPVAGAAIERPIDPLFRNFVKWAGALSVYSIYEEKTRGRR